VEENPFLKLFYRDKAHYAFQTQLFFLLSRHAQQLELKQRDLFDELVICDYVQRFRTSKFQGDRRNQVTYVAETLSDAIKASGAAGVLLSQLKRIEGREPTMDDVKESGDLENMAEHVLLGHKVKKSQDKFAGPAPDDGSWKRFIACPKNKDGPVTAGKIELPFNEVTASFVRVDDPDTARLERLHQADLYEQENRYGQ